jgi:hypothetical protein
MNIYKITLNECYKIFIAYLKNLIVGKNMKVKSKGTINERKKLFEDLGIGSHISSATNPHYYCSNCKKDLWNKYKRLKNPMKSPIINKIDDKIYCDKCYYEKLDEK